MRYYSKATMTDQQLQTDFAPSGTEALVCADLEQRGAYSGVAEDIADRQQLGLRKYGVSLADARLSPKQTLQHAYEEALDLANYLKRLIVLLDSEPSAEHIPVLSK